MGTGEPITLAPGQRNPHSEPVIIVPSSEKLEELVETIATIRTEMARAAERDKYSKWQIYILGGICVFLIGVITSGFSAYLTGSQDLVSVKLKVDQIEQQIKLVAEKSEHERVNDARLIDFKLDILTSKIQDITRKIEKSIQQQE